MPRVAYEDPAVEAALVHDATLKAQMRRTNAFGSVAEMRCLFSSSRAASPLMHACNDVRVDLHTLEADLLWLSFGSFQSCKPTLGRSRRLHRHIPTDLSPCVVDVIGSCNALVTRNLHLEN